MAAKVYTRSGDKGTTSLLRGGRVAKDDLRVEAYGALDELQSQLGVIRAQVPDTRFAQIIYQVQEDIFTASAELSWAGDRQELAQRITKQNVDTLEQWVDELTGLYKLPQRFVIPGATLVSAAVHVCRTVCRRCERRIVSLNREDQGFTILLQYFNRLSDLLFIMAWGMELEAEIVDAVIKVVDGENR